ncbi:MAG: hypothetical protein FD170_3385 [Bacteroidetes bacterium]|nr:MAG: hypothetical protein FD170_3385 [Bacteroidota bacterium]
MFNTFEYLDSVKADLPVNEILKASGITRMEEMLQSIRNLKENVIVARDSADGHLNLKDRRLDHGYNMFYVFSRAKVNDQHSVLQAKRNSMANGIKVLERIKRDSEDFTQTAYGVNFSRIDYNELGPIAGTFYGYSFGFLVEQGF